MWIALLKKFAAKRKAKKRQRQYGNTNNRIYRY